MSVGETVLGWLDSRTVVGIVLVGQSFVLLESPPLESFEVVFFIQVVVCWAIELQS